LKTKPLKKKLTLSIDPQVIEKARGLGINISEITEGILRGFSFTPSNTEKQALVEKYNQLFDTMIPLLKKYGASVHVGNCYLGEIADYGEIFLTQNEGLTLPEIAESRCSIEAFSINDFFPPKEILSKFIEALDHGKTERKQKITELEMAKRIIEAITNTAKKPSKSFSKMKVKKTKKGKKNPNDPKS